MSRFTEKTQVLRNRNYAIFFTGYISSLMGTRMAGVAVTWAVLESDAGATAVGLVLAASVVPTVVLMAFGGAIADRYGRRNVMRAADTLRALAQAALALCLLSPEPFSGHPPIWLFVVLSAIRGAGQAFYAPARSGLTAQITPRDQLGDANALYQIASSTATVCGPALGGVLIAFASPGAVIAIDAASFAVSVLTVSLIEVNHVARAPRGASAAEESAAAERFSIWGDMAEGWREFHSHTWLWVITLQFAFFNLITWSPWVVLGPVSGRQYLGGAAVWGAIVAAQGVGAIVSGFFVLGRRPRRPVAIATLGALCFALPDLPMAAHAAAAWVAAAALISGVGDTLFGVFLTSAMQQNVPPDKLARVSAFTDFPAFGIGVIGYVVDGPLASSVGENVVFGAGAVYGIVSGLIVLALPAVRSVTWHGDANDHAVADSAAERSETGVQVPVGLPDDEPGRVP